MKSSNRKHVQTNFHFFKKIVATEILVFDFELFVCVRSQALINMTRRFFLVTLCTYYNPACCSLHILIEGGVIDSVQTSRMKYALRGIPELSLITHTH